MRTYWRARRTENLLLVHYNALKADLEGEMRRIADFLSIEPPAELWPRLVDLYADFDNYQAWTDREIPVVVLEPR